MKIRVLGSAAGGGFPQWNCNCENCDGWRNGTIKATARTQSSIAVTENGTDWALINASPDILSQIRANPDLQPARQKRDSGIAAVVTDHSVANLKTLSIIGDCYEMGTTCCYRSAFWF